MRVLLSTLIASFVLITAADAAQPQPKLSKQDKQLLSQLDAADRKEVLSRMGPGESVQEIVETMALNRLSALYAEGKVIEIDVIKGVAIIQYKDGSRKTVQFTLDEIVIAD